MEIIIEADGEHTCCGLEVTRYQRVTWTYLTTRDGRFFQALHPLDVPVSEVTGTVVDIEVVRADGSRIGVERVPSGNAFSGNDPHDDGVIMVLHTEEMLDPSPDERLLFMVTLDVADGRTQTSRVRADVIR
ncbi:hypothetical protein ACFQRL_06855 [Microbacterium fluvii]|uniref:Uncharacterized protein n=1 Tax=Microbacterium fluvii TaxID=415215 RepID=A0ABW2HDZ9_9MICO|nr:hypothetical protein [Microbacterium fluvii]MCU4672305.1 hypothetical protein [Microbacterium fluvii]